MITVLAGGVGAARYLRGLCRAVDPAAITAIVNTGDDTVMHGLNISPDLDTIVYTLAEAIDPDRGWGLAGETWTTLGALHRFASVRPAHSHAGETWFGLGDQDLATHLYRTARLDEGALLHQVSGEIARAWGLKLTVIPMTDATVSTIVDVVAEGELSFQEYFVGRRHGVPVRAVRFAGAASASPAPGVIDALQAADTIVIAPSNPIVSIGPLRAIEGIEQALVERRERVVAISPIVAGAALKGPADRMLVELGHEASVVGGCSVVRPHLFHPGHRSCRCWPGPGGRGAGDALHRCRHHHAFPRGGRAARPHHPQPRHHRPHHDPRRRRMSRLTIWPVEGIGEIRPGNQLGDVIVEACRAEPNGPLLDGDVLVVTQKVVSKAENRLVAVDANDPLSHKRLVEDEAVRVVRRRGDLIITETRHGFICANSGVDLSNVERGTAALLPIDSDRSARRIRDIIRARLGVEVGIIVSDTFGRPWRRGLTDVAIGVAGIAGVVDLRGTPDSLGRIMQVTEVAVADEIAAAAELVMGKSSGIPVAVVRGVEAEWLRDASMTELIRPPAEDLFR